VAIRFVSQNIPPEPMIMWEKSKKSNPHGKRKIELRARFAFPSALPPDIGGIDRDFQASGGVFSGINPNAGKLEVVVI
jgi:hypothetical protein